MFWISGKGWIQKDSSHRAEPAIDAALEHAEIQAVAREGYGVTAKTHRRHVKVCCVPGPIDRDGLDRLTGWLEHAPKTKAPEREPFHIFTDED